jgi:Fe-S-cluster containining protein
MIFSLEIIRELLARSTDQRLAIKDVYGQLPATRCRRRTECCSLLPEISLLEALKVIELLVDMAPGKRHQLSKGLIRYFFLNPVEILSCPFLDGQDCLIYADRFFGCRAYGLWSQQYYSEQATRSQQTKQLSLKQWRGLGITLPQEVVDFHLPYCGYVELEGNNFVDDEMIMDASDEIEGLSVQLSPWHHTFRQGYFSDLSFLFASLAFTTQTAIQLKLEIVREALVKGNKDILTGLWEGVPDFWTGLT